jgi:hypothetical protein
MVRSTIVGLVAVLLIAKVALSLRDIIPNSADRIDVVTFSSDHTKGFNVVVDNGAVEFTGQNDAKADIEITSVLHASAHDEESARTALENMEVTIDGKEKGDTCKIGWRWKTADKPSDWSGTVSFKIAAPKKVRFECEAQNASVSVNNLAGDCRVKSENGKIVTDTSGESLEARTSNGVIEAKYSGKHIGLHTQNGAISADVSHARVIGGDITTQNGAVTLTVGDDTSFELSASTVNGRVLMPDKKRGFLKKWFKSRSVSNEKFGNGEGKLKVAVTNGVVRVRHVAAGSDSDSSDDDSDE